MSKAENTFIEILHNYINKIPCEKIKLDKDDTERLMELVKIHKVCGIFYSCLKDTDMEKDALQYLELGFYAELALYQRRTAVLSGIARMMKEENIQYILIKGSQIADMYPNPELRTMSDIDFIVRENDIEKVDKMLKNAGAVFKENSNDITVYGYSYLGINLEVHNKLVSDDTIMNGFDYQNYFENPFKHKKLLCDNTYVLEKEYNFLFLIFHISKHFYNNGCGVRMLMDLPIFIRNNNDIKWDIVCGELKKIKLYSFAVKMLKICREWFGEFSIPDEMKDCGMSDDDAEYIKEFIMSAGVFGFYGRNVSADSIKKVQNKNNSSSYLLGMVRWAFPTYSEMRQISPWFKEKPAALLWVAYIERFIRNARERGGIKNWGKDIAKGKNDLREKEDILKIMDLK